MDRTRQLRTSCRTCKDPQCSQKTQQKCPLKCSYGRSESEYFTMPSLVPFQWTKHSKVPSFYYKRLPSYWCTMVNRWCPFHSFFSPLPLKHLPLVWRVYYVTKQAGWRIVSCYHGWNHLPKHKLKISQAPAVSVQAQKWWSYVILVW